MPTAGWYPDPGSDRRRVRYWDGHAWTDQEATAPLSLATAPRWLLLVGLLGLTIVGVLGVVLIAWVAWFLVGLAAMWLGS